MKSPSSFPWKRLLLLMPIACATSESQAALLLYEGFAGYTAGSNLYGQALNANSTGFSGSWDGNAASQVAGAGTISASSLSFGSLLQTSAGSYVNTGGTVVLGSTLSLASPVSGTVWTSMLVRFNGSHSSSGNNGFEVRIGDNAGGATNSRFRTFGDSRTTGSDALGVDYNTGDSSNIGNAAEPVLTQGTTYLLISSFTNVAGSSGSGTATTWALTAPQFQTMMESPLGAEAYLAAATSAQYFAKATNTDNVKTTDKIETGNFLQIVNVGNNIQLDEFRMATTLAEAIPVVPEPGSATLALAGAALLLRRKRRL